MKHLVVLSGAGISAESGISTFRDANGLWEGHDVLEVASPEGFAKNPELVLQFYNQRRKQLLSVSPNTAHFDLVDLEKCYKVSIITQNVDNLHERAGSKTIMHLHGELLKVRSTFNNAVFPWTTDLSSTDKCPKGYPLRPHIVWFGEAVPLMEQAIAWCKTADILVIIGTSMQVYPAAGLIHEVPKACKIYIIDPNPNNNNFSAITLIKETATKGTKTLKTLLNY